MSRVHRAVIARPKLVVAVWSAVVVVGMVLGSELPGKLRSGDLSFPEAESQLAVAAREKHVPGFRGVPIAITVATSPPAGSSMWSDWRESRYHDNAQKRMLRMISSLPYGGTVAVTARRKVGEEIVSLLTLRLHTSEAGVRRRLGTIKREVMSIAGPALRVGLLDWTSASDEYSRIARRDLARAERLALPIAGGVLLVAFLSVAAALLPLLLAGAVLGTTLGVLWLVASTVDLSVLVMSMSSVLALGLSVDYALFIVSRYREEVLAGVARPDALGRVLATTGRAVLLSGIGVSVSLFTLVTVGIPEFSSMAIGGVVAGIVATLAALTLLPAVISLLGERMDLWSLRSSAQVATARLWHRLADVVVARPLLAVGISSAILVGLAIPALGVTTRSDLASELPEENRIVKEADRLKRAFGAGSVVTIMTREGRRVERVAGREKNVAAMRVTDGRSGWTLVRVSLKRPVDDPLSGTTVRRLRAQLGSSTRPTYVGGQTAAALDLSERVDQRIWWLLALAVVIGAMTLAIGLKSLVIPVKAMIGTLLSVGATLGLLVLLVPSDPNVASIGLMVPVVLVVTVFGLSLDYEVFLLSRIREAVGAGHETRDAVRLGLYTSARPITLAGVCLAIVFSGLATSSLDTLRQLGIGVALAILIDVTVVRCILMPAATVLFGRWNWWLPWRTSGVDTLGPGPMP